MPRINQLQFQPCDTAAIGWIPPIPGLHRQDPQHRYWLDTHQSDDFTSTISRMFDVSITGVLAAQKSELALRRIDETRDQWEQRGHDAHRAMELRALLTRNQDNPKILDELYKLTSGPWAEWISPLISHQRWDDITVVSSERPTCCTVRNVAGTFDLAYLDADIPPSPLRPAHITGPARILADLKTQAPNRIKWQSDPHDPWQLLAEVSADVTKVQLTTNSKWLVIGVSKITELRPLEQCDLVRGSLPTPICAPWDSSSSVEIKVTQPSTYSTAAQGGGYMALEATHGHWYDWHQSIWARPGRCTWGPLISVEECRWAWADAWATYRATPMPLF